MKKHLAWLDCVRTGAGAFACWIIAWSALGGGTVTNCTQSDLQAALVGGGGVIFGCSGTITLANTLQITQDTSITATGYSVTISGSNAFRIFQVASNVNFSLTGLSLANGFVRGADGVDAAVPTPPTDGYGAGILMQGGTLTLNNCILTNHSAAGGNPGEDIIQGGNGFGAAICCLGGTLNLTNCVLAGNQTSGGIGVPPNFLPPIWGNAGHAWGGAVYARGTSIRIDRSTFTNNSSLGGLPANVRDNYEPIGNGGHGVGGALYCVGVSLILSGSSLASNTAAGGGQDIYAGVHSHHGSGLGGALFLDPGSTGTIQSSTFTGNTATGGSRGRYTYAGAGLGGGLNNLGQLQIWNSIFSGNNAVGGSTTASANGQGGAIYSTNTLSINGCTLFDNLALGGTSENALVSDSPLAGGDGEGGGVWSSGQLTATNSTWAANQALGGQGGESPDPLAGFGPGGAGRGGGLYAYAGTASLVNVTVGRNRADGAPPWWAGAGNEGPAFAGALGVSNATVIVQNSIFASSGNGGEVWGNIVDAGYNLCSDDTANFAGVGSLNQVDPMLSALSDNGGETPTMSLLIGSPARDRIPSNFPPVDQRGVSRPQGPLADMGAFEADNLTAPPWLAIGLAEPNLSISFAAEAGRTYRLLESADFKTWRPVATNYATTAGTLQFVRPAISPSGYFCIVTP